MMTASDRPKYIYFAKSRFHKVLKFLVAIPFLPFVGLFLFIEYGMVAAMDLTGIGKK